MKNAEFGIPDEFESEIIASLDSRGTAELFLEYCETIRYEEDREEGPRLSHRLRGGFAMRWGEKDGQIHLFEEGIDPDRILDLGRGDGPLPLASPPPARPSDSSSIRIESRTSEDAPGPQERVDRLTQLARRLHDRFPPGTRMTAEWRRRRIQVVRPREGLFRDGSQRVMIFFYPPPPCPRSCGLGSDRIDRLEESDVVTSFLREQDAARSMAADRRTAPSGEITLVVAPGTGGVFLHEACGHALEADFALRGQSPFRELRGCKLAREFVTIWDDPTRLGLEGTYAWDDEGVAASPTPLVEKGVLKNFLTDRETARRLGLPRTGNGRRESFRDLPLPRMSNTFLQAGPHSPEEILRETRSGIFVEDLIRGRVNPSTGEFLFRAGRGRLIEDGKLTAPLLPFWIAGHGPRALASIDRVGDDLSFGTGAGGCGKEGQQLPVGVGQPTLRIRGLRVLAG